MTAVQWPLWGTPLGKVSPWLGAANVLMSITFLVSAMLVLGEHSGRGTAAALALAGICRPLEFLDVWNSGPWPFLTLVFGGMDRVFGAWALLRYPAARLPWSQARLLWALSIWMITTRCLLAVVSTPASGDYRPDVWWPTLRDSPSWGAVVSLWGHLGEACFGMALLLVLVRRLRGLQGLDRVVISPVLVGGSCAIVAAVVSAAVLAVSPPNLEPPAVYLAEAVVDLAVPIAFLVAVTQRRLLATRLPALADVVSAAADEAGIRDALRHALGDPTVDIIRDSDGRPGIHGRGGPRPSDVVARIAEARAKGRLVLVVQEEDGLPVLAVAADPGLSAYERYLEGSVLISGLALRYNELKARHLREQLAASKASLARWNEAELATRQKVERDLHDGVQPIVLSALMALDGIDRATIPDDVSPVLDRAVGILESLRDHFREFVHGVYPPALRDDGVAVAVREAASRLRLPTVVEATGLPRTDPTTEATAYFVAAEALTNAFKHAQAGRVRVLIDISERRLHLEVHDDGIGGLRRTGSGVRHMHDRVEAVGGEMTVDSSSAGGTRIMVSLPCG